MPLTLSKSLSKDRMVLMLRERITTTETASATERVPSYLRKTSMASLRVSLVVKTTSQLSMMYS